MYPQEEAGRRAQVSFLETLSISFDIRAFIGFELTNQANLAGQQAQLWNYKYTLPNAVYLDGFLGINLRSLCLQGKHLLVEQ